ncbi:MAG: hypothetical protein ACOY9D_08355 [Pseudomonadota bacterium]
MKITMDMSSYEIEQDATEFEEYDEEIMNTGWNPAVDLVCGLQEIEPPVDVTTAVVAEIVLRKMYSYQE